MSRITLRVTNVRVERLQDMSELDAVTSLFGDIFNPWGQEEDELIQNECSYDAGENREDDYEDVEYSEEGAGGDSRHDVERDEGETDEEEYANPWSATCWFELAFDTDPAELNVDYGRELLMRFLTERSITDDVSETLERLKMCQDVPADWGEMIEELGRRQSTIASLRHSGFVTVADQWAEHEREVDANRGNDLVGLRTGLQQDVLRRQMFIAIGADVDPCAIRF